MDEKALDKLHQEIKSLFADVFAITALALDKVAEMDSSGGYAAMSYQSTAHYLNFAVGMSLGTAREHVRVAKALVELPLLHEAFAKGSISFSKVRALTRIATPESEKGLLTIANESTASQLERIVRGVRKVTLDEARRQADARKCETGFDEDGMFYMRVRLLPDEGALVLAALEKARVNDVSAETRSLQADALMSLVTAGGTTTEVIMHVEQNAPASVETPINGQVAIADVTAERLACDASLVTMVQDKDGNVLDVGRKSRKIPAAIRRALQARDKGCRYPGCANTRVDAHHIEHWQTGGETKLPNLVQLCRFHHTRLHEGGYTIRTEASGELTFFNPHGLRVSAETSLVASQSPRASLNSTPWGGTGWWSHNPDYSLIVSQLV